MQRCDASRKTGQRRMRRKASSCSMRPRSKGTKSTCPMVLPWKSLIGFSHHRCGVTRISGPFLVLVVAGEYPEAHGYAPLRGYAQPIYNGRLFVPVESDFERKTLKRILEAQRLLRSQSIDLAIGKPLFDTMTPDGPCRPDFVLEGRSRETGELRTLRCGSDGVRQRRLSRRKGGDPPAHAPPGRSAHITPE